MLGPGVGPEGGVCGGVVASIRDQNPPAGEPTAAPTMGTWGSVFFDRIDILGCGRSVRPEGAVRPAPG